MEEPEWRKNPGYFPKELRNHDVEEQRATPWDGTGLPPVGTICEAFWAESQWTSAQIISRDESFRACAFEIAEEGCDKLFWSREFRPLPNEEDLAVREMLFLLDEHITPEQTCHALYRAGYRKREASCSTS